MFILIITEPFKNSQIKVVGDDQQLKKRLKTTLQKLSMNPAHSSLNSHKVNTPNHGERWSSWVTGDIRIIWDYDKEKRLVILLLDIGGHSGAHKVYK
jgi:mRNA-degrading endonuclease YafQ of YafQ-DinJ toxin-antitoxin module